MKWLYLISLLFLVTSCSTVRNVNEAVGSIKRAADALTPAASSIQTMADETTLLESNALPMIESIKTVSDQANFSLILLSNEATNTLVELQKTMRAGQQSLSNITEAIQSARQTLSNTTVMVVEVKQTLSELRSNIPPILKQTTQTLKSIRLTAVSVHKSQFEYHQFIKNNWGKIIIGLVSLLLISVFHGLIQRLILGKRG